MLTSSVYGIVSEASGGFFCDSKAGVALAWKMADAVFEKDGGFPRALEDLAGRGDAAVPFERIPLHFKKLFGELVEPVYLTHLDRLHGGDRGGFPTSCESFER